MRNEKESKKMMRITISIDPDEYQAIESMAKQDERSSAWVIRKAVREYLEREQSVLRSGT
jgi:predicted transcriptional regulator